MAMTPSKKEKKKLGLRKKSVWVPIITIGLILIVGTLIFSMRGRLANIFDANSDIAARVGDEVITKKEYNDFKAKYDSFYGYSAKSAKAASKDSKQSSQKMNAIDWMIEEKALQIEAKQAGVTVSSDEINTEFKKRVEPYGSEQALAGKMKQAYGWSTDDMKRSIAKELLRDKLQSKLLRARYVDGVYIRYDQDGGGVTPDKLSANKTAAKTTLAPALELLNKGADSKQIDAEMLRVIKANPQWRQGVVGTNGAKMGLNEANVKSIFESTDDWNAIKKLNSIGENTGIFESGGGYYAIYRLVKIDKGSYNNWDEFVASWKQRSKVYVYAKSYLNRLAVALIDQAHAEGMICKNEKPVSIIDKILSSFVAQAYNCSSGVHWGSIRGTIVDGVTNMRIDGATIEFHATDRSHYCDGNIDALDFATNSDGLGNFQVGPGGDRVSCFTYWNIKMSRPGYYENNWYNTSIHQNGAGICGDDNSNASGTAFYNGPYGWENTNSNCVIYMQAAFPPGDGWAVYEDNWSGQSCLISGWAVDVGVPTNQINVHIYMDGPAGGGGVGVADIVANSPWGGVRAAMQSAYGVDVGDDVSNGHGFHFPVPAAYKDNATHTAYAYGIKQSGGSNWALNGVPVTFKCGGTSVFYPWFQIKKGSVIAEGGIVNQREGSSGARPPVGSGSSLPTDVTDVIMNALANQDDAGTTRNPADSLMCSDNFYALSTHQNFIGGSNRNCSNIGKYNYALWDNVKGVSGDASDKEVQDSYKVNNKTASFSQLLAGDASKGYQSDRTIYNMFFWHNSQAKSVVYSIAGGATGPYLNWPRKNNGQGTTNFGGADCQHSSLSTGNITSNNTKKIYNDNAAETDSAYRQKNIFVCPVGDIDVGGNLDIVFKSGGRATLFVADRAIDYAGANDTGSSTPTPTAGIVKHNVTISKNIRAYIPGGAGKDPRDYPDFAIVVAGDIYIDKDVTDIDASLYATGKIYTCTNITSLGNPDLYYQSNGPACNKKLTIRGFIGSRGGMVLGRSYFKASPVDVADGVNQAAEAVSIPPLLVAQPPLGWGKWDADSDNGISFNGYATFSSPPRLK